jgi:hypothetical protein
VKALFAIIVALVVLTPVIGHAQFGQPQFSAPKPKVPRVSAGCSSPTCWYLCTVTKPQGQPARAASVFEMTRYDYADGDFALDLAQDVATQVGKSSLATVLETKTIAFFDSVDAFAEAAKSHMVKPDVSYFITGVCRK